MRDDGRPTATERAERLWPGPDPVNFAKREAVAELLSEEHAFKNAEELRDACVDILFDDLRRLHIHPTRTEILLGLHLQALRDAAEHVQRALDLLNGARLENDLRFHDECSTQRAGQKAAR